MKKTKEGIAIVIASIFFYSASNGQTTYSFVGNGFNASSKIIYYDSDIASGGEAIGYFPFGYLLETSGGNAGILNAIKNTMGPSGFDVMMFASGAVGEIDKIPTIFQTCAQYKTTVIPGTYSDINFDALLNNKTIDYRKMPGLLGWYHTDDANHGYPDFDATSHGYQPNVVDDRDAFVKAKDLGHITSLSLTGGCSVEEKNMYASRADFVGQQDYPFGLRNDNWECWNTYNEAQRITSAASTAETVPYMFTQSFTYGNTPKFPSAKEVDLQVYLSIVGGVKGIYFYAYRDNMEKDYPGFWEKTKQINKELKESEFGKALLYGKRTSVKSGENANGNLFPKYYGIWDYNGTTYVVAINLDPLRTLSISVPLPQLAPNKTALQLFPYRTGNLKYDSNTKKLAGTLPTQTVEIYVLDSPTSVEDEEQNKTFLVHPNPAKGELVISGHNLSNASYSITTIEGRAIQTGIISGKILVESLAPGFYFIKIKTQAGEYVQRFLKE
ncbi:MAG TPA: T9SS type A sorting domain-containing protein [Cytophagaceae bacterium]|jgi:hypothetical protein